MTVKTITLNELIVPKMNEYIAKVNARAHKLNMGFIEAVESGREMVEQKDGSFDCMVTFEIHGETPKVNGWTFVARIEHDPDLQCNILRVAPGQTLPREFWEADCNCDHCGTKRTRRDTFILREEATGEYKQIGRQCVRDFIGYDNPADMYWWLGVLDSFDSESDGWYAGMRSQPLYRVSTVLTQSIAAIRLYGYRSRRMVEEGAAFVTTATYVQDLYRRYPHPAPAYVAAIKAATPDAEQEAELVLNWIKGWDTATKERSEFNFNVSNMVASEFCRYKDFGLIACLPTIYLLEMDRLHANANAATKSNLHVGSVGQKIEVRVTIKNVIAMEGFYGVNHMAIMEDDDGNQFKWIASNFPDFGKGDVVVVKGTVKAHDDYKGRNQTVLTRCKMVKG